MTMPVNLFVVRHGQSLGNLAKRLSERFDNSLLIQLKGTHTAQWPLTLDGVKQAQQAGLYINQIFEEDSLHLDRAYVSSFARAMQTASHLGIPAAEWIQDPRITERDWGGFDNLTDEERLEKFGDALRMQEVEPFFWAPPNGESIQQLMLRVLNFIGSLYRAGVENVVVVCHGEVMKAFRIALTYMTPVEYAEMEFSKDPLRRIHNCQIDHYSRRNPVSFRLEDRLSWLQVYRPAENQAIAIPWQVIKRRRFSNDDLLQMAAALAEPFESLFE